MPRSKIYHKGKISRIVEKVQGEIKKHAGDDFVYFKEWYMTIQDNQLVVNIPYAITPNKRYARTFTVEGVWRKTL